MVHKPYCVSRLIQIFLGRYRFYIYRKCPKINTFQKGRCTHTWAAIVFQIEIAALSILHSVKFNDNPFFSKAIVIFCTQRILLFYHSILPCWNLFCCQPYPCFKCLPALLWEDCFPFHFSVFRIEHCPVELAVIRNLPNSLNGRFLISLFQVILCQDDHSQNSQHNASCTV